MDGSGYEVLSTKTCKLGQHFLIIIIIIIMMMMMMMIMIMIIIKFPSKITFLSVTIDSRVTNMYRYKTHICIGYQRVW